MNIAASLLIIILLGIAVFELLLALGLPYGNFAWGGQHKILPNSLRVASVFAIMLYVFLVVVVLSRTGFTEVFSSRTSSIVLWLAVVLFGIGIILNAISRSKLERNTFTPVVAVLFILCIILVI